MNSFRGSNSIVLYTPIEVAALRDGAGHDGSTGRGEGALS